VAIPTRDDLARIMAEAGEARLAAARRVWKEVTGEDELRGFSSARGPIGTALIWLNVDGRSELGRLFASLESDALPGVWILKEARRGFLVWWQEALPVQELFPQEAGEEAALEVIARRLGIRGSVRTRID
jgi:hypothetical protein